MQHTLMPTLRQTVKKGYKTFTLGIMYASSESQEQTRAKLLPVSWTILQLSEGVSTTHTLHTICVLTGKCKE
jgi:hypothetical protein